MRTAFQPAYAQYATRCCSCARGAAAMSTHRSRPLGNQHPVCTDSCRPRQCARLLCAYTFCDTACTHTLCPACLHTTLPQSKLIRTPCSKVLQLRNECCQRDRQLQSSQRQLTTPCPTKKEEGKDCPQHICWLQAPASREVPVPQHSRRHNRPDIQQLAEPLRPDLDPHADQTLVYLPHVCCAA